MKKAKEDFELHFHPREMETVLLEIPKDVLLSLKEIAADRDMSYQALLKLYIGQGLRQDLAKNFADHILEKTAQILARHIHSEKKVSAIIQEIREAGT